MTNYEAIREKNVWDLAEFILHVSLNATKISTCEEECKNCKRSDAWCISCIGEWLNDEYEISEGDGKS